MFVEEEHTHKHFFSHGDLLQGGVVGMTRPWCWVRLLIDHGCQCSWPIALLHYAVVMGKVVDLFAIVAWKTGSCRLLRWPKCSLLRLWSRSMVLRLELLLLLVLRAIASVLLLRLTWLSYGWGIHHTVLQRSTARPTTF
jgi:hypothetical protein